MDEPRRICNKRICLTYIFTFSLLVLFFYHLMWNNRRNIAGLTRLQEDIVCITQALKVDCNKVPIEHSCGNSDETPATLSGGGCTEKDGRTHGGCSEHLNKNPSGKLSLRPSGFFDAKECNSREMNACFNTLINRKLGPIRDDVYNIKKQVQASQCKAEEAIAEARKETSIRNHQQSSNRINYASEEMGARIISAKAKPIYSSTFLQKILGVDFPTNPPINILRPSLMPGSCFGFRGAQATITVHLAKVIRIEEISLSHVSQHMTPENSVANAPRCFEAYGISPKNNNKELLGKWEYQNSPTMRTQNFPVTNECSFSTLVLVFLTNHGANFTCVYHVEVYGSLRGPNFF